MHEAEGRAQTVTDPMDPARLAALHATLGRPGPVPELLPPFAHQIHFWQASPPEGLGADGHPRTGAFIPDLGLPRRMWAGGRLMFHAPLRPGTPAERQTSIVRVARKQGRSGPLGFVTLCHEIFQDGTLCRTEEQDLVYREAADPEAPPPLAIDAPLDETEAHVVSFDTTLLFRYSALTFNGHRIHYDTEYARQAEGYPGLVVHGPLLAHLLMDLAEDRLGGLQTFKFRATAPLFHFETAELCLRDRDSDLMLWVRAPDGRQCMVAEAM
ncbi:acyl dehydratase [Brevirhabdus pacifica]|uniref:Acyl dehydratase n=1 Tax=Brevirhabdus pacifica TaxID=1267768 RepID=A0A1U7DJJ4_9RHOB|nr:MaoC family dehydratase N-terminal domain-containing protein [Brevirhabdus pacifica]APX90063.1 acyl dehydratase [Brevirhabdus pacifica]OWU75345.1 acyl dehydratase [Loktanella sp. 22II-4b]PJJ82685.1 3-methylfumaryl-CoA hydratase [Brevirhabdus pacifica]